MIQPPGMWLIVLWMMWIPLSSSWFGGRMVNWKLINRPSSISRRPSSSVADNRRFSHPPKSIRRSFIPIERPTYLRSLDTLATLRVMQFNILADGLSGLRTDLGAFSRASRDFLKWEHRGPLILEEILQYDPDVITLQECDHFYDYFLPELEKYGYLGFFAPKPASACLEVSSRSDGCAMFLRRCRFEVQSVEVRHSLYLSLFHLLLSYFLLC